MSNDNKLEKLQCTFPKLTEANQQYVLGLAEGLKTAQKGRVREKAKEEKTNGMVKRG
ncbi:MAG: hypothetical protein LBQ82_03430 [Treponema sp.]|jgi:hypothetical protein|nr:hypothetical protein [Treponema sp.]